MVMNIISDLYTVSEYILRDEEQALTQEGDAEQSLAEIVIIGIDAKIRKHAVRVGLDTANEGRCDVRSVHCGLTPRWSYSHVHSVQV